MKQRKVKFTRDGITVTIVFNSVIAQAMAQVQGADLLAVTVGASTILVSGDYITGYLLAHEWGHILHRRELGRWWLLHIIRGYVVEGHDKSPGELRADGYRDANWTTFPERVS